MRNEWTGAGYRELPIIWGSVEPLIVEALEGNGFFNIDTSEYWNRIMTQAYQLWVLFDNKKIDGIMLTALTNFQNEFICDIFITAGADIKEWTEFQISVIEPWAREQGCTRIEFTCRKGIAHALAPVGYHNRQVVLTKYLSRQDIN